MSTRRKFIAFGGAALSCWVTAGILTPALQACAPTSYPPLAPVTPPATGPDGRVAVDVSDLTASNPVKIAPGLTGSNGMPILITFISPATYYALSSLCTHQSCQVQPELLNGNLPCLCHGSEFGLDGSVKKSPATNSLKVYDSIYDAALNQIRIKLA